MPQTFRERLARLLGLEGKASRTAKLIAWAAGGQPVWTPRDLASLAREGFAKNAVVYRSVRMIAEAAASVPLFLFDGESEVDEHPLLALLAKPNPARGPSRDFRVDERREINRVGSHTGFHACGRTDPGTGSGNFVPDHQPATSLNSSGRPQRLYPQCVHCSRTQGGSTTKLKGPRIAVKNSLALAPDEGRRVLQAIADSREYPQAGDADMSLWALDEGIFKPT